MVSSTFPSPLDCQPYKGRVSFVSCLSLSPQTWLLVSHVLCSLVAWPNKREKFKAITSCYNGSCYLWMLFWFRRRWQFLVWVSILHSLWPRSWGKRPTVNRTPMMDPWSRVCSFKSSWYFFVDSSLVLVPGTHSGWVWPLHRFVLCPLMCVCQKSSTTKWPSLLIITGCFSSAIFSFGLWCTGIFGGKGKLLMALYRMCLLPGDEACVWGWSRWTRGAVILKPLLQVGSETWRKAGLWQ